MDGKLLKKLREELNMTQKELADRVQVTPKAISFYELNQREPSNELLVEFSKIFNVSTDYLLGNHINNLNFSNRLKALRKEKNLSQEEMAIKLNISTSAYGYYEQGKTTPNISTLNEMAKIFNVTTDYLLGNSNVKQLSRKDEIDIQKDLEEMKKDMTKGTLRLSLDGEIVDDEIKQFILDNMENTLILAKIKAKEKFNPNKNKK